MILMPRVAARAFNTPLMIDPGKAAAIMAGLGGRIVGGGVEMSGAEAVNHVAFANGRPSMGVLVNKAAARHDAHKAPVYDVIGNVAVIPVEGTLVYKGAFIGQDSGETSYQGLQVQIQRAAADPKVKGVVFEVDSYGGEVTGAFETAEMIARLSAKKPTIAVLTDFAYSAGYLMASACRQIVMPEYGGAGSIGVISLHVDYTKKLEKDGIKVNIVRAGEHKAEGNPYEPLPDAVRDEMQALADKLREKFTGTVGRYRGARFTAKQAMATEAKAYRADEALKLGLVDGIGDVNEMFAAFVAAVN